MFFCFITRCHITEVINLLIPVFHSVELRLESCVSCTLSTGINMPMQCWIWAMGAAPVHHSTNVWEMLECRQYFEAWALWYYHSTGVLCNPSNWDFALSLPQILLLFVPYNFDLGFDLIYAAYFPRNDLHTLNVCMSTV